MTNKALVIALLTMMVPFPISAKRVDPPKEATPAQIAKVLRSTNVVGVFCGQDVDFQTCTFFQKALSTALAGNNVTVLLSHLPEVLVQSFYVPPMQLPFTNVTIRLIEDNSVGDGVTRLWMGGFGFDGNAYSNSFKRQQQDAVCKMIHDTSSDPSSPPCPPPVKNDEDNVVGFQLPRWVEAEGVARDTGPLEADRAAAASSIVHEFIAYWKDAVKLSANGSGTADVASLRKTAEGGGQDAIAASPQLGLIYYRAQGVPQDYAEAYFWFEVIDLDLEQLEAKVQSMSSTARQRAVADARLSALKEDLVPFDQYREDCASHLTPQQASQEQERAQKWLEDHPPKVP